MRSFIHMVVVLLPTLQTVASLGPGSVQGVVEAAGGLDRAGGLRGSGVRLITGISCGCEF